VSATLLTTKDFSMSSKKRMKLENLFAQFAPVHFVLAEAGILKGKKATTFHRELDRLSNYGAMPVKERVVVEGKVITGAGVTASIDVGLKIAEILLGKETARKVGERIEYRA